MMNFRIIKHNLAIAVKVTCIALLILSLESLSGQTTVVPAFSIDNAVPPCENYIKFSNNSQNATHYLWSITHGSEEFITPTFEPQVSIGSITDSVDISVSLTAMNNDIGGDSTLTKTFTVYPRPGNFDVSGRNVICKLEKGIEYSIEEVEGYAYNWGPDDSEYFDFVSAVDSPSVTIDWKQPDGGVPQPIELYCDVTSDMGCESRIFYDIVLLESEVPESAELYWKSEMNTLLCVFGNNIADNYTYLWGYVEKGSTDTAYFNENNPTTVAYYQLTKNELEGFNTETNTYFVTVISKECPLCKFTTNNVPIDLKDLKEANTIETVSIANLYPNPVNGYGKLSLDIISLGNTKLRVTARVVNFSGTLVSSNEIEISQGRNNYQLPLKNLDNGHYFLQLSGNGFNGLTKKFIVVNN